MKNPFVKLFTSTVVLLFAIVCNATNLKIENPILYLEKDEAYVQVWVNWENAWHNDNNHDAVWLFFKMVKPDGGYIHLKVAGQGHEGEEASQGTNLGFQTPPTSQGVIFHLAKPHRGKVDAVLKIKLEREQFQGERLRDISLQAYGVEMVQVPAGAFQIGETGAASVEFGAFYQSNGNGEFGGPYRIDKEDQTITVGKGKGHVFYQAKRGYEGDQQGEVPPAFPKGVDEFYAMKYEYQQGMYVDFLNSLPQALQATRSQFLNNPKYTLLRGHISLQSDGIFATSHPSAPCNYLSWADHLALADWCGLSPMTELEFTKTCRGNRQPATLDYPWGTEPKWKVGRWVDEEGNLLQRNQMQESQLTDDNRVVFSASQYWVMDMAGSMWERCISIGSPEGRAFKGSPGDGLLDENGFADNEDWPGRLGEGEGFGFRGGGFYNHGRDYHAFNPFSPIAYRTYGGWAGHGPTEAYGGRFVLRL